MTIDNTPAIRAFVEERLRQIKSRGVTLDNESVRELEMVLTLCDGLTKQNELLARAFPKAVYGGGDHETLTDPMDLGFPRL